MKRIPAIALLLALFALPLFAGKNSQEFSLPANARVGDVQLQEGHCTVTWTQAAGSQVQLTIKTENQKTITVPAQMVEGKPGPIAVQTYVSNGQTYIKEFDTKNARFVLVQQEAASGTK